MTTKNYKQLNPSLDKTIDLSEIYFHPGLVCFLEPSIKPQLKKKSILSELAKLIVSTQKVPLDQGVLVEKLLRREMEVSTYLGNGIALPHFTLTHLPENFFGVLAIIKLSRPIEWKWEDKATPRHPMESIDFSATSHKDKVKPKMVDMVWGLVSSEAHHLKNLKGLTQIVGNSKKINALRTSKDSIHFFQLLTGGKQPKNIAQQTIELNRQSKIFESTFLMPPHWQFHARPATAFVQYVKKLLTPFYGNSKSAPLYSLWIKYGRKFAHATNLVEVLSLGIEPNKKISFLITSTNRTNKNTSLNATNVTIADGIIKQAKAFLLSEAIKGLQHVDYPRSPHHVISSSLLVDIENHTKYKKIIADVKKKSIESKSVEIELRSFGNTSSIHENFNPLQLNPALLYVYQHPYQNNLISHKTDFSNTARTSMVKATTAKKLKSTKFIVADFNASLILLERAIVETQQSIVREQQKLIKQTPSNKSQDILSAHHELLNSQTLIEEVKSYYYSHLDNLRLKHSFPPIIQIWEKVIKRKIKFLNANPSHILRARVDDWRDLERRVALKLWELLETENPLSIKPAFTSTTSPLSSFLTTFFEKKKQPLAHTLIAEELLPSQVVELSPYIKKGFIKTVILKHFNPHSHAMIMLANYQIAVLGLKEPIQFEKLLAIFSNSATNKILINSLKPSIFIGGINHFPAYKLSKYNQEIIKLTEELKPYSLSELLNKHKSDPIPKSVFGNVKSLEFLVNINKKHDVELLQDVIKSKPRNAKKNLGVGLFRSELYFGHHKKKPSVTEQIKVYRNLAKLCYPAPVVVRTIDVAKDKLIPFLKSAFDEPNQGHFFANSKRIKYFSRAEQSFVVEQIRALSVVAQEFNNIQVLFPMVVGQEDFFIYLKLLGEHRPYLKCGVMIEAPALLYELPLINPLVDFYSIGTNDLTKFLNFEPREKQGFDEPNDYMSLLLALEHISQLTHNLPKLTRAKNKNAIPLILCGNHATNQNLLYEFIELSISRFSVPLSVFHQFNEIKEFFKNQTLVSKSIKKNHAQSPEHSNFSNLKDLRHYLFNTHIE